MRSRPLFGWISNLSPTGKIFALVSTVVFVMLITMLTGLLAAVPFWGRDFIVSEVSRDYSDPATISFIKYFQIISQFGVFIFPVILFVYFTGDRFFPYTLLNKKLDLYVVSLACMVLLVSAPLIEWFFLVNKDLHLPTFLGGVESWMRAKESEADQLTAAFLRTTSIGGFLINILMVAILPAIGEELLFRGVLLRLFNEWIKNFHWAILITAVVFSAMHLQFYGFLPRMLLGIILGYLFYWSRNLWVPILAHLLNNMIAVVAAFLFRKGMAQSDYNEILAPSDAWVYLFSAVLTVICLWLFYRRTQWGIKVKQERE